jgi:hypothetical protein
LTVTSPLLLDPHGYEPTRVNSVVVNDLGIGVVRRRGEARRLLPWGSVVAHAVEPWGGGVIPEWWVDPVESPAQTSVLVPEVASSEPMAHLTAHRHLPHAEAGALISIRTRTGTYRSGLSTVTTVAPARLRRGYDGRSGWVRVRPILAVFLVVTIVTAVTLILLQSAGVIHLPFLGGTPSSAPPTPSVLGDRSG